jgi:hypothetical protein
LVIVETISQERLEFLNREYVDLAEALAQCELAFGAVTAGKERYAASVKRVAARKAAEANRRRAAAVRDGLQKVALDRVVSKQAKARKALIDAEIARIADLDEKRRAEKARRASMTFEEKLQAIEDGTMSFSERPAPVPKEYDFSLTGCASAMCADNA